MKKVILLSLTAVLYSLTIVAQESQWESLLDKNLSKWDVFMGVPHYTVKGLDSLVPKGELQSKPIVIII